MPSEIACGKCKIVQDLSEFGKNKRSVDGLNHRCKSCCRNYKKERRDSKKTAAYDKARSQTPGGKYIIYKKGANARDLPFDLTFDEFMTFWQADCSYCGDPIHTIGIDRVDSNLGYSLDNCVPCCAVCNRIKMAHDEDFLFSHIIKMLRHKGYSIASISKGE